MLALPALEHLVATSDYGEIWISSPVVPLISFGAQVRPLSSTGIDLVGLGDLPVPEKLAEKLRTFDSIVSWYGTNRPEFRGVIEKIGTHCEFLEALPPKGHTGHAADFFAAQVGAALGQRPRLHMRRSVSRHSIVVHPFSGSKQKNWPLACYRALAARLPHPVEWVAGPEEPLAEVHRFEDLSGLAAWVSGAALYIGNDSGITHLAGAAGVPVLALFGPTDPAVWGPRGKRVITLRSQPLEDLPVERVLAAANRLLG